MKIAKTIGVAVVAILAVAAAVAAYVALTFDEARIKQEAAAAVLAKTGRVLVIDGDLSLRFWPSLGVKADKVTLSERNRKDRFASFDTVSVSVQVMPLLSKRVVADRIELDGLKLVLVRDRENRLNIDDLIGGESAKDKEQKTPPPEFDVHGIRVADAQIEWRDQSSGRVLKIADLDLETGRATGKQDRLRVEKVKLATRGRFDADDFDVLIEIPDLTRKADEISLPTVDLDASLKGKTRSASLKLGVRGIEGTTQALRIGGLALELEASSGGKSLKGNLKSPLSLDLGEGTVVLPDLSGVLAIDMPGLPVHPLKLPLRGKLKTDYRKPALEGRLSTAFDETHIDARFNVAGSAPPNIGLDVVIDKLNVDRYFPPAAGDKANAGKSERQPVEAPIDMTALKSVNGSGSLRIGELQARGVKARNLRVTFRAANGRIDIAPHAADLYGGHLSGSASLEAHGNQIRLKETLSGVDIEPLLQDLAKKDVLEGRGDVVLDVALHGATVTAMKRTLSGSAAVVLRDGAIKGINLARSLREAKAKLAGGAAVQSASATEKTDFSELAATFKLANGIAHNDDLSAKSPFLRLGGNGAIDIGNGRLDYLLKASVVGSAAGQGGKEIEALRGMTLPVRVSGPFEKPSFRLEFGNLLNDAAKQRIEEKREDVKRKLQENFGNQLKGLFGK